MKHICPIILSLLLFGCGNKSSHQDRWFKWESIDAESDSVIRQLERAYAWQTTAAVSRNLISSLDSIAVRKGDNQLMVRTYYWKARFVRDFSIDSAHYYLDKAEELNAADIYPYDTHRIRSLRLSLPDRDLYESYKTTLEDINFYRSAGDSIMLAASLGHLGVDLNCIGDTRAAECYISESNELFEALGMKAVVNKNFLNVAVSNIADNPQLADSLLSILRKEALGDSDINFTCLVLLNSYKVKNDTRYLDMADSMLTEVKGMDEMRLRLIAARLEKPQDMSFQGDSLKSLLGCATMLIEKFPGHPLSVPVLNYMAEQQKFVGDYRSAYMLQNRAFQLYDSLMRMDRAGEIAGMENRMAIERFKNENQLKQREHKLILYCVIVCVSVLVVSISVIYRRKLTNSDNRRKKAEIRLNHKQQQLSVTEVVLEESDRMINEMNHSIETLCQENKIDLPSAKEIGRKLKAFNTVKRELDLCKESKDNINPQFVVNLKNKFPEVTDTQIKLACYVVAGLSSKQVALKMGISPDSVKKSRYRLKLKMGLAADESLDDALRKLANL